jgi:hypothetical protein
MVLHVLTAFSTEIQRLANNWETINYCVLSRLQGVGVTHHLR